MDIQWWIALAVVAIVVAVVAYRRFLEARERQDQDLRINVQALGQARSAGAEITQREDRRLAGMTAEDQAWEQASLQRHRESEARIRQAETSADQEANRL